MTKAFTVHNLCRFREIIFYGIVGGLAFCTHFTCVFLLVHYGYLTPLAANACAFIISFNVSFWGHHHYTFAGHDNQISHAMLRLFVLASTNFFASMFSYYILLNYVHLQYLVALFFNLSIIASISFIFSKLWVFRAA